MAMNAGDVYEFFKLYISNDKFVIQPHRLDSDVPIGNQALVIERVWNIADGITISIQQNAHIPPESSQKPIPIYGIFGIVHLLAGPSLIVITKRQEMGTINDKKVFRVESTDIIPVAKTTLHLNETQIQDNRVLVSMVEMVLGFKHFYFATDFDLTHSLQRLANTSPEFLQMPLHERADLRFVWNHFLLRDLAFINEAHRYTMPIMLGFVEIHTGNVAGHQFQLALISRRSCFRAGVRFHTRGLDAEGHTANFVETEQIVEYGRDICSFVQTRGSIPLVWSQKPNLRWQPFPKVMKDATYHSTAFRSHFQAQKLLYGQQLIVNLINRRGRELAVGSILEDIVIKENIPNVTIVNFDFHREGFNRVPEFVQKLVSDVPLGAGFGYFMARKDGQGVPRQQGGVFRTNCMDCLDRTNVVQTLLAKWMLQQQLRDLHVLVGDDHLELHPQFQNFYKRLWADCGDVISVQYAGTGALKADFTRTGQRTYIGMYNDLYNALHRYYINNFQDGFRQDAIDMFLGNVTVPHQRPIFIREWDWHFFVLLAFVCAFAMVILCYIFSTEHTVQFTIFWLLVVVILIAVIVYYGEEFVNKTTLRLD